jgi:hypothetical protein
MPKTAASPYDPDAQAFITAAAITDVTQQGAINTLVIALKGYSIWTKFKAIYPIVGGTASSHKYNLKDPRDLDVAFRLNFSTGYTHSATGMLPNGTSAYADTFYNPFLHGSINNVSAGVYLRTNLTGNRASFGVLDNFFSGIAILPKWSDNNTYYGANDNIGIGASNIVSDTRGFFQTNRIVSTTKKLFKNGSIIGTSLSTSSVLPNFKLVYSARNYFGAIQNYDLREIAFGSIGDGLTDTEASNFYTAVQAFQTSLSRQV